MVGWWVAWLLMLGVRLYVMMNMILAGGVVAWCYVLIEGVALGLGLLNTFVSKHRDYSFGGFWIGAAYALGALLLNPSQGAPSIASVVVGSFGSALSLFALMSLGARFTFGGSAWVKLCDTGLYRLVRHPQLAARVLVVSAYLLRSGMDQGVLLRVVICCLLTLSVVMAEERYLLSEPEYLDYAGRVPWRLVPGIW